MFFRVKRVNGNDYVYLVENVREGGRHVQRIIKTLGRRDQVEAQGEAAPELTGHGLQLP